MQFKAFVLASLLTLAAATPTRRTGGGGSGAAGPQCCQQVTTAGDSEASKLIGLLNINVSDINVPVGLNCVPITVVGGGNAGCNTNTVTCDASNWGGLIAINCLPISLGRRTDTPPPPPPPETEPSDQCCKQVTTAGDSGAQTIIGLLNINVSDINVPVGLNCVPITVVGGGAAGCNDNALTCKSTSKAWLGLIAIDCLPINLGRRAPALPPARRTGGDGGSGSAGPQCCQQVTTASDPAASKLIGLLNINVSDVNVPVGLNCVPITVVGGGSAGCNDNTVNCEQNNWGGLIAIGCVII